MEEQVIYLEPDEEITSVVDKLKRSKSHVVGIVAPRGAVLLQSVVNLKLLKKQAKTLKKDIALVTSDKIGQNLALRTGITVFANVHDSEPLPALKDTKPDNFIEDEDLPKSFTGNFRVHRYDEDEIVDANDSNAEEAEPTTTGFSSKKIGKGELDGKVLEEEAELEEDEPSEEISKFDENDQPEKAHKAPVDREDIDQPKEIKSNEFRSSPAIVSTKTKAKLIKFAIIFTLFIIIAAFISYLGLSSISKASVQIVVSSEDVEKDLEVTVKTQGSLDSVKNIIPGRLIESNQEVTQKITATGKKDIGEKATGKITVSNEGGVSQSFEANTAFKSPAGLIFRSAKAFTVPAGTPVSTWEPGKGWVTTIKSGTVIVDVVASESGVKYNIDAASYTLTGYSYVKGEGTVMTGGATKEVTIVSKEDIDKAIATTSKELYDKGLADLKKKSGGAHLLETAVKNEMLESASDTEIGTQAADFNVTVRTKSSVLVFDNSKLDQLINSILEAKIPEDKSLLKTETNDLKYTVISSNPSEGLMQFSTQAKGKIIPKFDESRLIKDLAGKSKSQVETYLRAKDGISDINTTLTPSWWLKKIPSNTDKVEIKIVPQDK